ncbi:something about silencing protein 10 [Microbotryomycetes sp. JL221]|nr:something about silencing protein 10 [Microbotryomycetes sp. JL221]
MAKGSKGVNRPSRQRTRVLPTRIEPQFDKQLSKINALQTRQDAFGGDQDEFHRQRDMMAFANDEDDSDYNDNDNEDLDTLDVPYEIYSLNLPNSDDEHLPSSNKRSTKRKIDQDDHDQTDQQELGPTKRQYKRKQEQTNKGRFTKDAVTAQNESGSEQAKSDEEEDDDDEDDDDDDDIASPSRNSDDEQDEEERWAAHQYHVSRNQPGEADSEDEEALELEAQEALRLQKKTKQTLSGQDFGLDDDQEDEFEQNKRNDSDKQSVKGRKIEDEDVSLSNQTTFNTVTMSKQDAIALLLKNNPETLALLDDFKLAAERVDQVEQNLLQVRQGVDGKEHPASGIMELEHQAITTYLHTLGFYFSILLSSNSIPNELVSKVLSRLSNLRQALATMEELDLTSDKYEQEDQEEELDQDDDEESGMLVSDVWDAGGENQVWSDDDDDQDKQVDDDEDQDEEEDEDENSILAGLSDVELEHIIKTLPKNSGATEFLEKVRQFQFKKLGYNSNEREEEEEEYEQEEDQDVEMDHHDHHHHESINEQQPMTKKQLKLASKQLIIPELAPMSNHINNKNNKRNKKSINDETISNDLIEPTSISKLDEKDKLSTRHSLRFHVSQVNQKVNKRQQKLNQMSGDDDVPRRSKENARREVLKKQQHGNSLLNGNQTALDDQDWDEQDLRMAKRVKGVTDHQQDDDNDDVTDLVDNVKRQKDLIKMTKKAKYDQEKLDEKNSLLDLASSMPDGPRGATRQILANKGLTPRRKKENRNARVKKRLQYDKAKKKLDSVKSVYKGGLAGQSYEGEKTGIGKKTVKSRKL